MRIGERKAEAESLRLNPDTLQESEAGQRVAAETPRLEQVPVALDQRNGAGVTMRENLHPSSQRQDAALSEASHVSHRSFLSVSGTRPSDVLGLSDIQRTLLEHYRELLKLQRETTDRWFRFYLVILGVPLGVLSAIVAYVRLSNESLVSTYLPLLWIAFVFLCVVGTLFLAMNTRQRVNAIRYFRVLKVLERSVAASVTGLTENVEAVDPDWFDPFRQELRGADFYVGLVHVFLNACYLATAILVALRDKAADSYSIAFYAFLIYFAAGIFLRDRTLESA